MALSKTLPFRCVEEDFSSNIKSQISELVRERASYKGKVIVSFKRAVTTTESSQHKSVFDILSSYLDNIEAFDEKICELYASSEKGHELRDDYMHEISRQSDYLFVTKTMLSELVSVHKETSNSLTPMP